MRVIDCLMACSGADNVSVEDDAIFFPIRVYFRSADEAKAFRIALRKVIEMRDYLVYSSDDAVARQ
jgi:hypothetical protein